MAGHLGAWIRPGATVEALDAVEIDYDPGRLCRVMWRVWIDGRPSLAVVTTRADRRWDRAPDPGPSAPASDDSRLRRYGGVDPRLHATIHWFPHDPAMPALSRELGQLLGAGAQPTIVGVTAATDLAYRPGERAVRRIGDSVVKWYARPEAYERALDGFAWAQLTLGAATAPLRAADPDARMIVQAFVDGEPIERDGAVVAGWDAGAVLRRLHESTPPMALVERSTDAVLHLAREGARLLGAIRPELNARIVRLIDRLAATAPYCDGVASHGDFNVSQMIRGSDGTLVVLDFDELCTAAPAYDVAAYVTNVVGGRAGDADDAARVMDGILAGYGQRPDGLGWYLSALALRRARSPFRLQKARWSERVAAGLAFAETALEW